MDFGRVGDGFYQVLGEGIELKETEDENETGVGVEEKDRWNEKGRETTTQCKRCAVPTPTPTPTPAPTVTPKRQPLLPRLHTFKISGLEGGKVRDLIRYREVECRWGEYGVKRWIVRCNKMYKERDGVLDELVERGWEEEGRRVVVEWLEEDEDDDEDDDEEDEEEGEEGGEGDGEQEEQGEAEDEGDEDEDEDNDSDTL